MLTFVKEKKVYIVKGFDTERVQWKINNKFDTIYFARHSKGEPILLKCWGSLNFNEAFQ